MGWRDLGLTQALEIGWMLGSFSDVEYAEEEAERVCGNRSLVVDTLNARWAWDRGVEWRT